jgi:hypothetical protein
MCKPVKIKDAKHVTFVLPEEQFDYLKKQALQMSATEGRQIGVSEAIRRAVERCYPIPRTRDLFGDLV